MAKKRKTSKLDVKARQYWRRKSDGTEMRVLAVVEGFVIAREPYSNTRIRNLPPIAVWHKQFVELFERLFIAEEPSLDEENGK